MAGTPKYSEARIVQALALYVSGKSNRAVARETGIPASVLRYWRKKRGVPSRSHAIETGKYTAKCLVCSARRAEVRGRCRTCMAKTYGELAREKLAAFWGLSKAECMWPMKSDICSGKLAIDHIYGDGQADRARFGHHGGFFRAVLVGKTDLARLRVLCYKHNLVASVGRIAFLGGRFSFGKNVFIGPFSIVRENTVIGDGTHIGDHAQLMGDLQIGAECRFHSNVHISKNTQVGDRVFIAPGFVTTNVRYPRSNDTHTEGCTIEDDAKIGANVTLLPGVRVGRGALIGSGAVVTKDVPPFAVVVGNPARVIGDVRNLKAYQ